MKRWFLQPCSDPETGKDSPEHRVLTVFSPRGTGRRAYAVGVISADLIEDRAFLAFSIRNARRTIRTFKKANLL